MRNQGPRAAILVCAVLASFAGSVRLGGAQESTPTPSPRPTPTMRPTPTPSPRPTPTPPACAMPNIVATVLRAATPVTPLLAEQQGIQGTVQVIVSLDENSRVIGARIQRSPNAVLNPAALTAARQTTFRTDVRDCRPIAADYLYVVEFVNKATVSTASSGERIVSVVSEGTVTRTADVAYVLARIETHDDAVFGALTAKLGALGIDAGKIRRTSSREIEITVDTAANAGHAAAAVASVAGVDVIGISFGLKDRDVAYREALRIALNKAEISAREAAMAQGLHLGARMQVTASPNESMLAPAAIIPFRLVPIVGGFKEPDIRIPVVEVHASASVTYAIKP